MDALFWGDADRSIPALGSSLATSSSDFFTPACYASTSLPAAAYPPPADDDGPDHGLPVPAFTLCAPSLDGHFSNYDCPLDHPPLLTTGFPLFDVPPDPFLPGGIPAPIAHLWAGTHHLPARPIVPAPAPCPPSPWVPCAPLGRRAVSVTSLTSPLETGLSSGTHSGMTLTGGVDGDDDSDAGGPASRTTRRRKRAAADDDEYRPAVVYPSATSPGRRYAGGTIGSEARPHLELKDISAHFSTTVSAAAASLGVGVTYLKKRCRELGVHRWPGRKLKSLQAMEAFLMGESHAADEDGLTMQLQAAVAAMDAERADLSDLARSDLGDSVKMLRQCIYKMRFRRRRQELRGQKGKRGGGDKGAVAMDSSEALGEATDV